MRQAPPFVSFPLFLHNIYQSAGHINLLHNRTRQLIRDCLFRLRDHLILRVVLADIQSRPVLAVNLHHNLYCRLHSLSLVIFRPFCLINSALKAYRLPQLLRDMRRHRVQQGKQRPKLTLRNLVLFIELVHKGHHRRDRRVVFQILKVTADLLDGLVHLNFQIFRIVRAVRQDIL